MIANYHGHTKRCRHAKGEDRDFVEAAIAGGLKILGFSDHCPWFFKDGYVSGTRMLPQEMDDYFTCIDKLRDEYKDDITIYIGLEAEYVPQMIEEQYKLIDHYPLDYMIIGQHFTGIEPYAPYTGFETDREEDIIKYVDLVIEGMETGRYKYVAHPDLLNFVGSDEVYEREFGRLCEYLKSINSPVEINMLGLIDGRHYPSVKFFDLARRIGNTAIIGCDAHQPERLSNKDEMRRCEEWAAKMGIELVTVLPGLDKLP